MEKEKKDRWYIYPGDDKENGSICNTMRAMGQTPQVTTIKYKGEDVPVFESDPDFIDYLTRSREGLPFKFKVFWEDEFGTIRIWKLHLKVVKKRAKAHRRKKYLKTSAQKKSAS
jgi:hypothetical protein